MSHLNKLADHNEEWLKYVYSFGECNCPEDIVQEMYLRIERLSNPDKYIREDGTVNKTYIWYVLRNLFIDYHKQSGKIHKEQVDTLHIAYEETAEGFEDAYEELTYKVNREMKTWSHYDQKLFKLYTQSDLSLRELAKETNISVSSIYNTIKNCKARLTEATGEDYEDFINGDYDKL